ncbi:putative small secreted protein [Phaeoacremonium minimum UCRPA7]|uniref:Putative small secreted protein n=1 Tax=Phaeoacremonium minimum (strain UCR-PA7) TaxID=1286976 RepID=R8B8V1_PHAM7|nr:putative small secreted protein [Phaeoacremonium minimum UCRPA7]EON95723.1 putative small secreted protein [Phaeoacremonium minimum UCRPA7]
MKFSIALLAAAITGSAFAAPTKRADPNWTIESMKRTCNSANTQCVWDFGINTHLAPTTHCTFTVKGTKASQLPGTGAACGAYTVTSGWSGQFGAGNGFTTLAVVDNTKHLITWPAYTDKQLVNGVAVKPDQSYPPTKL